MEFLPGQPYNKVKELLAAEERRQIEEELGQLNRRINTLRSDRFGYYAQETEQGNDWPTVFAAMVSGLLADAQDKNIKLPADEEEVAVVLRQREAFLKEVATPSLVHWDLWDGNVFVEDGRITGLIDCERVLWGDPLMEYYFRSLAGDNFPFLQRVRKRGFHERRA